MKKSKLLLSSKGFTLIELLLVVAVIAAVSTFGVASFASYSRNQIFNQDVIDFVNTLNTAKSKANSQTISSGPQCAGRALRDYRIRIWSTRYVLYADCPPTQDAVVTSKTFPTSVFGVSGGWDEITFHLLTGGVTGDRTITMTEFGNTKTITVTSVGVIKAQ